MCWSDQLQHILIPDHCLLGYSAPLLPKFWIIHCDGSAVPNPGRIGLGAVLVAPDSSLLVAQLGASGAPPMLRLAALYEEVAALPATFAQTSLHWIPRHRNDEADALARVALGLAPKGPVKLSKSKKRRR